MEVKYLPTCEVGVDDNAGGIEPCNEPAWGWVKYDDGSEIYACQEHFWEIEEEWAIVEE